MDDGEYFKEICARFGAAIYFSNCLEHGIANALVYVELVPALRRWWTPEEHDAFYASKFDLTLGNLVRGLKKATVLPQSLVVTLDAAKERRDYLAHHFFIDRVDDYASHYVSVFDDLEQDRSLFERACRELDEFMDPILAKYGFTQEVLDEAMGKYTDYIRARRQ